MLTRREVLKIGVTTPFLQLEFKSKPEETECYKIVSVINNRYFSYCHCIMSPSIQLEYYLNQWTTPKYGYIFAFKNINHALNFNKMYDVCIFRSLTKNYHIPIINSNFKEPSLDIPHDVSNFWKIYQTCKYASYNIPEGTIFCKELKLIERIA